MTEEKAKMSVGKKIVVGLIIGLAVLTAAAYGVGVYYFTNHFLPGSMVNGLNCSYMTVEESEDLLAQRVGAYVLAVQTRNNGQESITAQQAGLVYTPDGSVKKLMTDQDRFKWFLAFNQSKVYETAAATTYSTDKLNAAVSALNCMQEQNTVEPTDAYIQENDTNYEIVPENQGAALEKEKMQQVLGDAVVTGKTTVNLEEAECYKKPAVYSDDETLVKDCKQLNVLTSAVITYDFGDRAETVDKSVIRNWLVKNKKGNYTLDKTLVAAYVNELGYKYDTFGCTRTFITYDGREKTLQGGDYGWAIDQEAETAGLIKAIKSGETAVREPVYAYEGWSRDTNDIGYTYVEIDLTNQRMVFYQDGIPVVDTPVVTGNPAVAGNATPTGCYAIDAMKSPSVLKGENYAAEVTYWMPFAGNVGIHDATWRAEFGGTLYLTEGSHGCVNTPYDMAEVIYNNIEIGAPVIVYE